MKRKLLLLVLFLGTSYFAKSQVIDVIGKGVYGKTAATIELTDLDNINHVDAVVISKGLYSVPNSNGVEFDNSDTASSTWSAVDEYNSPVFDPSVGSYSRTFNSLIDKNINVTIQEPIKNYVHSFFTYIYRDIAEASYISFANLKSSFIYHNGSTDPVVYEIPINSASTTRNIMVKIPITELDKTDRMMVINIEAGPSISEQYIETTWGADSGNSFLLGEYVLENVPGDVTNIVISIYSPNKDDMKDGDSFFISGVVVDVDKVPEGCTLTQGYWKNHSDCSRNGNGPERDENWDKIPGGEAEETIFFLSKQDYCEVFDTNSGKGGKYYILAHQYMATELNILAGANPTEVQVAFDQATSFLEANSPSEVKGNEELEGICVALGGILDDYNNGRIGPGHCDEISSSSKILNVDELDSFDSNVKIYPNPVASVGKINFIPNQNAETTVEIYNILGQKIRVLYHEYTIGGMPVTIEYNTQHFKKGIHFVHIKNGSSTVTKKLSIGK